MTPTANATSIRNQFSDYLELCKPKVVLLMLVTSSVGMLLAPFSVFPWQQLIWGNIGIGLCASAAAVINHVIDWQIDSKMHRTQHRPIAAGRVQTSQALILSLMLGVLGVCILYYSTNLLTTLLTISAQFGYAVIYTAWLKRATTQNIVIGGLAGAMPPMLGWSSVTHSLDPQGWLLVAIVFLWTPPHFWALAMAREAEYKKISIPMLPVEYGKKITSLHSFLYSVLLGVTCLLPVFIGMFGIIYTISALCVNLVFIWRCWKLWKNYSDVLSMRVFWDSINYLLILFLAMLLDRLFSYLGWNISLAL